MKRNCDGLKMVTWGKKNEDASQYKVKMGIKMEEKGNMINLKMDDKGEGWGGGWVKRNQTRRKREQGGRPSAKRKRK